MPAAVNIPFAVTGCGGRVVCGTRYIQAHRLERGCGYSGYRFSRVVQGIRDESNASLQRALSLKRAELNPRVYVAIFRYSWIFKSIPTHFFFFFNYESFTKQFACSPRFPRDMVQILNWRNVDNWRGSILPSKGGFLLPRKLVYYA